MLTTVISMLIYICIVALVIYLVLWVVRDVIGLPIPEKVVQILWVIFALIVILAIVNMLLGSGGLRFPSLR